MKQEGGRVLPQQSDFCKEGRKEEGGKEGGDGHGVSNQ